MLISVFVFVRLEVVYSSVVSNETCVRLNCVEITELNVYLLVVPTHSESSLLLLLAF